MSYSLSVSIFVSSNYFSCARSKCFCDLVKELTSLLSPISALYCVLMSFCVSPTDLSDYLSEFFDLGVVDPMIDRSSRVVIISVPPACSLVLWLMLCIFLSISLFIN